MNIEKNHQIYSKVCGMNMDISCAAYADLDRSWCRNEPFKFNYSRLYFVLDGEAEITVNGVVTTLKKGNIYFVPSGTLFSYSCNDFLKKVYFHINVPCFEASDFFSTVNECMVFTDRMPTVLEIYELFKSNNACDTLKIRSILYSLLCEITAKKELSASTNISPFVSNILDYLNEHFTEHPTEEDIGNAVFASRDKVRKSFRNEMNIPLGKYIDNMLLDSAEKELRTTTLSIKEISQKYGYCDQFYFSRIFCRRYGVSPQKYRKASYLT